MAPKQKRKRTASPSKKKSKNLGTTPRRPRAAKSSSDEESESRGPTDTETGVSTASDTGASVTRHLPNEPVPAHLNDEQTVEATQFMESHPALWNKSHEDYYQKEMKKELWVELANLFPKENVTSLQKWWKNQRDCFTKKVKPPKQKHSSGQKALGPKTKDILQRLNFMKKQVLGEQDSDIVDASMESINEPVYTGNETPDAVYTRNEPLASQHSTVRPTFRAPSATVSRPPSLDRHDEQFLRPSVRSLRTSSPADSMRSLSSSRGRLSGVPYGMSRLHDEGQISNTVQDLARANQEALDRDRDLLSRGWHELETRREELRLREEEWDRKRPYHFDMERIPRDSRLQLLHLGNLMGSLSPESLSYIDGKLANLTAEVIKLKRHPSSTTSQCTDLPRPIVGSGQSLIDFKEKLNARSGSTIPPPTVILSASDAGRRYSSPIRPGGDADTTETTKQSVPESLPSTIARAIAMANTPEGLQQLGPLSSLFDAFRSTTNSMLGIPQPPVDQTTVTGPPLPTPIDPPHISPVTSTPAFAIPFATAPSASLATDTGTTTVAATPLAAEVDPSVGDAVEAMDDVPPSCSTGQQDTPAADDEAVDGDEH